MRKAEQDELALHRLIDDADINDDVLGFHAQQAVEKRLKAVLTWHEVKYRRTHSIAYLTRLLDSHDIMPPACRDAIEDLTPWASQARYEDIFDGALDRATLEFLIAAMRKWSDELLGLTDWLSKTAVLLEHFAEHGQLDHLALLVERDWENGVQHVTLDGSSWAGPTTPLILTMLLGILDMEGRETADLSEYDTALASGVGTALRLETGLAGLARDMLFSLEAKQVLLFARSRDDHAFIWSHATPERIIVAEDPPDSLSKLLLGIDEIATESVGGGVFDKPDPDVRFSAGAVVRMTDFEVEGYKTLKQLFRDKFGRDPGPTDPVFFDPTADEPRPMSREQAEQFEVMAEELGATELSKQVAAEKVRMGMVESGGSERSPLEDRSPYSDVNPLPLFLVLSQAAAMEGSFEERCLYAVVHSWAEGHLAASEHPEPADTDTPLHAPPFPDPDAEDGRIGTIVAGAIERFGEEGIDGIAYAAAFAWKLGREEGAGCDGCAIERASSPVARAMRDGEMVVQFHPYFGDGPVPSALLDPESLLGSELPDFLGDLGDSGSNVAVVSPESPPDPPPNKNHQFRVCIRTWEEDYLDRHEFDRMPSVWIYYVPAGTADEAREHALGRFPEGADSAVEFGDPDVSFDRTGVLRMSVDVQRVGLPQEVKEGTSFHLVGVLRDIPTERLGELAGYLEKAFPAAVVACAGEVVLFGVTVNAETHDEAEADVAEALAAFGSAIGIEEDHFVTSSFSGQGGLGVDGLLAEIHDYERR